MHGIDQAGAFNNIQGGRQVRQPIERFVGIDNFHVGPERRPKCFWANDDVIFPGPNDADTPFSVAHFVRFHAPDEKIFAEINEYFLLGSALRQSGFRWNSRRHDLIASTGDLVDFLVSFRKALAMLLQLAFDVQHLVEHPVGALAP